MGEAAGVERMKILVALDRSDKDAAVLAPTLKLAGAAGTEVVLLNVVSPWLDTAPCSAPAPEERLEERLEELLASRQAHLEETAQAFTGGAVHAMFTGVPHAVPAGVGS
jgi:nucleotide-binding universal stress UspA family protein